MTASLPSAAITPAALLAHAARFRQGPWARTALQRIAEEAGNAPADAARLAAQDAVTVVTGQQPAVGGGPLYTLVKTAHAIAVARQFAAQGQPVVPVFWCASEDHDLGEAGHADLIARDGRITRIAPGLGSGAHSLRFRVAATWWPALRAGAADVLGPGPGSGFLDDLAPLPDEQLGAWHCRLVRAVFAGSGLVALEGHRLRPLWRAAVGKALDQWPAPELAALRSRLLAEGRADPFGDLAIAPLFADRPDGRTKLDPDAARALLATAPDELSPGAALRPILQQAALPAPVYVGGPGEIAYHAFITPAYAALGVTAPILVPRASLALLPTWLDRDLRRWGVRADDLRVDTPAPPLRDPPLAAVADALAQLDAAATALAAARPAGRDSFSGGERRLEKVRGGLRTALTRERRRAAALPAFGPLRAWLFPRDLPQDRVMSLFQALWHYGPGLGPALVEAAAGAGPGGRALVRG
jgi:hypothetical protein